MNTRANIRDVAQRAGVSKSTVSRVLTHDARVNATTRARVEAAVRDMGYRPNALARGLLSGRTQTIGLVVFGLHNPFFGILASGVDSAARALGYNLLISTSNENLAKEMECLAMFAERRVDGVLIVPIRSDEAELHAIQGSGHNVVLLNSVPNDATMSSVGVDDLRGGYLATSHLLGLGHRRISIIGDRPGCITRLRGYRLAHEERGVPVDERLIVENVEDVDAVNAIVRDQLSIPTPPTAIFATNDELAIEVLHAVLELGLAVPHDIALVGYDDIPVAARLAPALTTVAQPKEDQGRLAVKMLVDLIDHPGTPAQRLILQPRLVVRQSCGADAMRGSAATPDETVALPARG